MVAMALAELTAADGVLWDLAWTAAAVAALAGTLARRRAAAGTDRSRWTLWAAATGCWLFGQIAWDLFGIVGIAGQPRISPISAGGRSRCW